LRQMDASTTFLNDELVKNICIAQSKILTRRAKKK
jgi:hypothetical protein